MAADIRETTAFVYVLVDPRDESVRYVGKAAKPTDRLTTHVSARASVRVRAWVAELSDLGLAPRQDIVAVVPPGEDVDFFERQFITMLGRRSSLLNDREMSDGMGTTLAARKLRAHLRAEGTSISAWCAARKINRLLVQKFLKGGWKHVSVDFAMLLTERSDGVLDLNDFASDATRDRYGL